MQTEMPKNKFQRETLVASLSTSQDRTLQSPVHRKTPSGDQPKRFAGRLREQLRSQPRIQRHDETRLLTERQKAYNFFAKEATSKTYSASLFLEDEKKKMKEEKKAQKREDEKREEEHELSVEELSSKGSHFDLFPPSQQVYEVIPSAEYVSWKKRCAIDLGTLFYPSATGRMVHDIESGRSRGKNMEEDGLYVGEKPFLDRTNANIIRNRFARQHKTNWIWDDGSLKQSDNPVGKNLHHYLNPEFQNELLTNFVEAHPIEQCQDEEKTEKGGVLNLVIGEIMFKSHHLFTKEHHLVCRLKEVFQEFSERRGLQITSHLEEKLKILRSSLGKLKHVASRSGTQHVLDEIDTARRFEIYKDEVRECRRQLTDEGAKDRELLEEILDLWIEIKKERERCGFSATDSRLLIHKQEVKGEEEKWRKEIQKEVQERMEEEEEKYAKNMKEHKIKIKKYKEMKKERRTKLDKIAEENDEEGQIEEDDEDKRPEAPSKLDKKQIKEMVTEEFLRSRRPPGEPIIALDLELQEIKGEGEHLSEKEKRRRNNFAKTKISVLIFVNGKKVTETIPISMDENFSVKINRSYHVAVEKWPKNIRLDIFETISEKKRIKVAPLFLPVPGEESTQRHSDDNLEVMDFQAEETTLSHVKRSVKEFPKGIVKYHLKWATGDDGKQLIPSGQKPKILSPDSRGEAPSIKENTAHIDPNDPRNAHLLKSAEKEDTIVVRRGHFFECDGGDEFFCSSEELDEDLRLQVLKLRSEGLPEFKGLKVPANDSLYLKKLLEKYWKGGELQLSSIEEDNMWSYDKRWDFVESLLSSVRKSIQKKCAQASSVPRLEDMVQEEKIPDIGALNSDYSASGLQAITDNLYFYLFDEVLHNILEDDRLKDSIVHQHIENRWLGSLKIPFSTLYINKKIEGTFRLENPNVLLGYTFLTPAIQKSSIGQDAGNTQDSTYLTIYVTTEPSLTEPPALKGDFDSVEPENILVAGRSWSSTLKKKFPKRMFRTHVLDLSGRLVALNRFISPLKPPKEAMGQNRKETMNKLAWFVSCIPTVPDMTVFPGTSDIWANCEQFFNLMTGDEEEHAVLLTNLLIQLGEGAYLLIGSAIPEGLTCYVLVQDAGKWYVWDAKTARRFDVMDAHSPLKAVFLIVSEENIYANVQEFEDPSRLDFDISSSSNWKPFYSKSFPTHGLPTVQPKELKYFAPDLHLVKDLKERLLCSIRDAVMKWRTIQRTPWNRYACSVLQRVLEGLEVRASSGAESDSGLSDLQKLTESHKLCGVCLHQGYSTIAEILEAVHSTGVHLNLMPETEFAVAVHVQPYPCNVLSVWIYVASLLKKM